MCISLNEPTLWHWAWDKAMYFLCISSCSPALTPMRIIEQDCRSATCQLADTAMLVLKWIYITVTHSKQVLHRCPRWPLPGMRLASPGPLSSPQNPLVRNTTCLKWKSMFRFTGAWHLPALSQAIKIDEIFITRSPFPKDHDRAWVRVRGTKREWVGGKGLES